MFIFFFTFVESGLDLWKAVFLWTLKVWADSKWYILLRKMYFSLFGNWFWVSDSCLIWKTGTAHQGKPVKIAQCWPLKELSAFRLGVNIFKSLGWMDRNCISPLLECLNPCNQSRLVRRKSINIRTDCYILLSVFFRFLSVKNWKLTFSLNPEL